MNAFVNGWYVLYTKPRHEKKVCNMLSGHDIEYFFPQTRQLRVWSDRKKFVEVPVFASYVFIYLKNKQDYFNGLDTDGALYYIRMGKDIVRVNDQLIADLRRILVPGADVDVTETTFSPGQRLMICSGPLLGMYSEVVEHMGASKILVRVNFLQRNVLMTINAGSLMPAAI